MRSIFSAIELHAERFKQEERLTFLEEIGVSKGGLSYEKLHDDAQKVACQLHLLGLKGKPVILVFPTNESFVTAFLGCIYSGAIAVPATMPGKKHNEIHNRLIAIVKDTGATLLLSDKLNSVSLKEFLAKEVIATCDVRPVESLVHEAKDKYGYVPMHKDIAFIQYSSGTTSRPKGIVITNENILTNLNIIQRTFKLTSDTRLFGWLPLYHDMGLIGNLISMIYAGGVSYMISPHTFMQKPYRWLQGISHYRADTSGGPNFAYDLCVEKITDDQLADLDLSVWKTAFNGAEIIRPQTLEKFSKKFQVCGFDQGSFLPCYGLAEGTLLVSGAHLCDLDQGHKLHSLGESSALLHTSGPVCDKCEVRIVDTDSGQELNKGQAGEVWISGGSVTNQYWGDTGENSHSFVRMHDKTYFKTGDLGLIIGEQLFITGRLKEMIIIRGKNYLPNDIEINLSDLHPALVANGAAAFSIDNNIEQLVVLQEIKRSWVKKVDYDELKQKIHAVISANHGIAPDCIGFVLAGKLQRTTSGKLKRREIAHQFMSGNLEMLNKPIVKAGALVEAHLNLTLPSFDDDALGRWVIAIMEQQLQLPIGEISIDTPFSHMGIDSVGATRLTAVISDFLQISLEPTLFMELETIYELIETIKSKLVGREVFAHGK